MADARHVIVRTFLSPWISAMVSDETIDQILQALDVHAGRAIRVTPQPEVRIDDTPLETSEAEARPPTFMSSVEHMELDAPAAFDDYHGRMVPGTPGGTR